MDNTTTPRADAAGKQASGDVNLTVFIEYMPLFLMALACLSLLYAVAILSGGTVTDTIQDLLTAIGKWQRVSLTFCWLVWVITMGCMGGIASLGMQAIKVPKVDSNVNISDRQLAMLRVILGGLFALVLTFALESDCFIDICHYIGTAEEFHAEKESPYFRAFVLIVPFLLGFSTSLVMTVINQLNAGVLAFFGGRPEPASGTPARQQASAT